MPCLRNAGPASLLLAVVFAMGGCNRDSTAPSDLSAIALSVVSGNSQSAMVGTELPSPVVIKAVDNKGDAIAGLAVNFRVTSGGCSVFGGVATTDNKGIAEDYWTLGTSTAQSQTLEVRAVTSTGQKQVFGVFAATPRPGPAAQIAVQAGDGQVAVLGTSVSVAPAVHVSDQYGNPVPNLSVTFAVGIGGGSVTGPAAVTDASGTASVGSWTLGSPGPNSLKATATGSGISANQITFTATSVAWLTKASMPTPRSNLSAGVVNGILYAVGGVGTNAPLGVVEAYDPATNSWTTKVSMPTPRYGLSAGVVNGILYAVGGWGLNGVE